MERALHLCHKICLVTKKITTAGEKAQCKKLAINRLSLKGTFGGHSGRNTQNYTEKVCMTQIIMMV